MGRAHVVQSATLEGHCFTPQDDALCAAAHLVEQPIATLAAVLAVPPRGRSAVAGSSGQLWIHSLRHAERYVAEAIVRLQSQPFAIVHAYTRVN